MAGYSEKSASSIGWENLRKPEIAAHIERRLAELTMPASEVLKRLTEHARGSLLGVVDESGRLEMRRAKFEIKSFFKSLTSPLQHIAITCCALIGARKIK